MSDNWPTKDDDMSTAQRIIEEYAEEQNATSLGLFELVVNQEEKKMDVKLSSWVLVLADYFKSVYGPTRGDVVTRQVISYCITRGETIH